MKRNIASKKHRISPLYICMVLFLIFYALICVAPFWYVMVASFSDPILVKEGEFHLFPTGFSLESYQMVLRDQRFFSGIIITVLRTVVGTGIGLLIQCMTAYVLSRRFLVGRGVILKLVVFTILFNGGIIPNYLVVQSLNLLDSFWALILPMAFNPWNVILLVSFFKAMPDSIEESAKLDGANDFIIFIRLAVPLSIPAVVTILLFIAVRHWNELMDGVIYINSEHLKPLQVYLIELVMRMSSQNMVEPTEQHITSVSIQTTVIFLSCLPILILYPFLQRYFVKGIMVGAIKG